MNEANRMPALIPTGRVSSPLAKYDQRLHLIGLPGLGQMGHSPTDRTADNPFEPLDPFAAAGPLETPVAGNVRSPTRAEDGAVLTSAHADAVTVERTTRGLARPDATINDSPRAAFAAETSQAAGSTHPLSHQTVASVAPSVPAEVLEPKVSLPSQADDGQRDRTEAGESTTSSVANSRGATTAQQGDGSTLRSNLRAHPARPDARQVGSDQLTSALASALEGIHRWMASEPQPQKAALALDDSGRRQEASDRATADAGRGGDHNDGSPAAAKTARAQQSGMPRSSRTRPPVRQGNPGSESRAVRTPPRQGGFLPTASAPPHVAGPRLNIGRIDVQVVTPAVSPVVAAARPARSAPVLSSGPSALPYLNFGLRQR